MIIVSVTGPSMSEALAQVAASAPFADIFEFRLDLIRPPEVRRLCASTKKPVIATCRPAWEGGNFTASEEDRLELLRRSVTAGADYIDIELAAYRRFSKIFPSGRVRKRIIVSHHLTPGVPCGAKRVYSRLHATGAEVIKFAYTAEDVSDIRHAIEFLALARKDRRKAVAIAMGEHGEPSRVLYRKFGGWATYASAEDGEPAAPGQISARLLKQLYRSNRLTRSTRVFGVVGNPLKQSKGIYVHNRLFSGMNAVYCRFPARNLAKFIRSCVPFMSGFSVTSPFKKKIIPYLQSIDERSRGIGAINTVIHRGGRLKGTNSDAPGALDAVEKVMAVRGKSVLIVGAGGAARAIMCEARRRGALLAVANRTKERAMELAREFGARFMSREELRLSRFDIIINATSVGMFPHVKESPLPRGLLKARVVFDAVYNPPITRLLRDADRAGARIIQGTEMYLNQAAVQSELFTGRRPDVGMMRRVLAKHL